MGLDMNVYYSNGQTLNEENYFDVAARKQLDKFYWRKANAIHHYFVEAVQEGKDNCQLSEIPWEVIQELKMRCEDVLASPSCAPLVLPTQPGFFFGTYDYDEWYMNSIKETLEYIEEMESIKEQNPKTRFYYKASW